MREDHDDLRNKARDPMYYFHDPYWDNYQSAYTKMQQAMLDQIKMQDAVQKPAHYNTGEIEAIMYLEDNMPIEAFIGYLEGSVKKYLHRWRYKNHPQEDLEKALWYLERLLWKHKGLMLKDFK